MTHSLCPKIVHKEKEKYGVENTAGYTMRDCKCENDFSACLMTSGKIAKVNVFLTASNFEIIRSQCQK